MQGGLVYGYIGQTEYIIRKMKEESGLGKINVVATGGLGKMIAKETSFINYYDANLTLKGLLIISVTITSAPCSLHKIRKGRETDRSADFWPRAGTYGCNGS